MASRKTRPFVGECDDGHFGRSAFGQQAVLFVQSFLCSLTDFYDSSATILLTRPEGYANPRGVNVLLYFQAAPIRAFRACGLPVLVMPPLPKRMLTPKMLERWAYRTDRNHGNQFDQESRTGSFWFYNDAGRPLGEYARALRNFGLWLQRTCTVSGNSDIQQWYGKGGQAKLIF
ncbi:MAG: hypothetical protein OXH03_07600 [Bacteroidetes bacterium]|nr:hypothetical protein [Bacteroidota bacterium]MDE2671394.1 hypothetical protein [Bacteroidota bacterium]